MGQYRGVNKNGENLWERSQRRDWDKSQLEEGKRIFNEQLAVVNEQDVFQYWEDNYHGKNRTWTKVGIEGLKASILEMISQPFEDIEDENPHQAEEWRPFIEML